MNRIKLDKNIIQLNYKIIRIGMFLLENVEKKTVVSTESGINKRAKRKEWARYTLSSSHETSRCILY